MDYQPPADQRRVGEQLVPGISESATPGISPVARSATDDQSQRTRWQNFAQWQPRLAGGGRYYWQGLEELADSGGISEARAKRNSREQADVWPDALSRRRFLSLMAASLALGGISGCSVRPAPASKDRSLRIRPKESCRARPLFFATTMTSGGDAVGLLVESHWAGPRRSRATRTIRPASAPRTPFIRPRC